MDYFQLSLTAGDTVEIVADSMLIDPMLSVDYRGAPEEAIVLADESVGIYEDGDKLTFTAPHTGRYYVSVYSPMTLGYAVQVKQVPSDADGTPTPAVADASWRQRPPGIAARPARSVSAIPRRGRPNRRRRV